MYTRACIYIYIYIYIYRERERDTSACFRPSISDLKRSARAACVSALAITMINDDNNTTNNNKTTIDNNHHDSSNTRSRPWR